ncbi:MAG TPA: DNA-binding response regulator [Phycisphaerales bacterium]|nr:DNA-binding response regulator [Phycisphaerales bacterium]
MGGVTVAKTGTDEVTRARVLVVEDEADIANLIQFHLAREGYQTEVVGSGRSALNAVERQKPDLVVLDIMLPDLDGLEVCRKLKRDSQTHQIPILMVSARGEESDIVVGLELGAEDYVTKPFSPRVLIARVKAVLRRRGGEAGGQILLDAGTLVIDPARHTVEMDGAPVELTLTQYRLLHFLASRPGFVRTRDQIVAAVRGEGTVLSSRAIDVHVAALRQRLGDRGELIETVRGVGYRLSAERAAQPA